MLLNKQSVNKLISSEVKIAHDVLLILCFFFLYICCFSFSYGFRGSLYRETRKGDRCEAKGTFGVFSTAQCFLQLESDILPTLAGLLYCVGSVVYFRVDF